MTPTVDSRTTERKTQHSSDWEQSCDIEDDRGRRKAIGQSSNSVGRSKTLDSAPTTRNKESGTITEKKKKKKNISVDNFNCQLLQLDGIVVFFFNFPQFRS